MHKAVRFTNELNKEDWKAGHQIVEILLDAGCDPRCVHIHCIIYQYAKPNTRIRNKANLKPFDLVDPRNTDLRSTFQKAEYSMQVGDDVIQEDDDGPIGSGSESD